ncbi:gp436 family protein [Rhodobacter capsulatus]|uniref:gp436 family protein n=1 Tax=Rhodobacter capsulatus TaxID=1061 RepID=UPI0040280B3C
MTYATQQQMIDRYGTSALVMLTDRAEFATGVIDAAMIDRALADADAMIDGYLRGRYDTVPLDPVPPQLPPIAQALAYWSLHLTEPDGKTKADYDTALRMLKDIADGRLKLAVAGAEPQTTAASGVRMTDRSRPLSADAMKGFI